MYENRPETGRGRQRTDLTLMTTGTISMINTEVRGVSPAEVSTAKAAAPNTPAAPVPDDQVDTTFLATQSTGLDPNKCECH
ncbi:hypothetical protein E2C01_003634 [Portunus trituberculatus]|uniref:Uncharacterized protein n=1 Tax=Portunus trituberculatus TaxID=210409 RepID=A0A5B7CP69_PORTR|nr:hypothetical protein [Portunus trituberculatus]